MAMLHSPDDERGAATVMHSLAGLARGPVAIFVASLVAYYLAARFGLSLLAEPEKIAVFWPASGIAAGLIVLARRSMAVAVALGVAVATVLANLDVRGSPALAVAFGTANAIECLSFAVMARFSMGRSYNLERFRHVLTFMLAAVVASALAAIPAALALKVFTDTQAGLGRLWLVWTEADSVGIIVVAPALMTLPRLLRDRPPLVVWLEAGSLLLAIGYAAAVIFGAVEHLRSPRLATLGTIVFPLLLWLAARAPMAFSAFASLIIGTVVTVCTRAGLGELGDAAVPLGDRVGAVQIRLVIATLCALSLAALFAEWRRTRAELQRANMELRALSQGLEMRVSRRTAELVAANEALARESRQREEAESKLSEFRVELAHVQRVTTAGELAAYVAHEISQPLNALSSTANALLRLQRSGRLDPDSMSGHLDDIAADANRASGIIRQLRRMMRKAPPRLRPIGLERVVEETLQILDPIARRRGVAISRELPAGLPLVEGDRIQLSQVVLNLVRNAIEAVAESQPDRRKVTVRVRSEPPDRLLLEVEDSGPGLSQAQRDEALTPFVTSKPDGLGMGLPISDTIARAHGARLVLLARPDGQPGTLARVTFPTSGAVGSREEA